MPRFVPVRRATALAATVGLTAGLVVALTPGTGLADQESECTPDGAESAITADAYGPVDAEDLAGRMPWAQTQLGTDRLSAVATGKNVTVAVMDSGVDSGHPLFHGNVLDGNAYINIEGTTEGTKQRATLDCMGHGTAVASIIAGSRAADFGFQGLAPNATILPIRVSVDTESEHDDDEKDDNSKALSDSQFADAVRYAVDSGAKVINMSLKYSRPSEVIAEAISYAIAEGAVVVAAAGNGACEPAEDGSGFKDQDKPVWPAHYDGVLGVAAVDQNLMSVGSRCGPWVDLVAPGAELIAALPDNKYTESFGATSAATAFVSGTAALLWQLHPNWTSQQVSDQLLATASPVTGAKHDPRYGYGIVDPMRALTEKRTGEEAAPLPDLTTPPLSDEAVRKREDFSTMRTWGAVAALVSVAVFVSTLLGVGALRRAKKRNWRTSRVDKDEQLVTFDDGDPISLYQGIKGLKQ